MLYVFLRVDPWEWFSCIKYDLLQSFPHSRDLFISTFNTDFSLKCFSSFINIVFHLFFVSFFCWAHNEKYTFGMIIDANKSKYLFARCPKEFRMLINIYKIQNKTNKNLQTQYSTQICKYCLSWFFRILISIYFVRTWYLSNLASCYWYGTPVGTAIVLIIQRLGLCFIYSWPLGVILMFALCPKVFCVSILNKFKM